MCCLSVCQLYIFPLLLMSKPFCLSPVPPCAPLPRRKTCQWNICSCLQRHVAENHLICHYKTKGNGGHWSRKTCSRERKKSRVQTTRSKLTTTDWALSSHLALGVFALTRSNIPDFDEDVALARQSVSNHADTCTKTFYIDIICVHHSYDIILFQHFLQPHY